jgi:hypothetical protein
MVTAYSGAVSFPSVGRVKLLLKLAAGGLAFLAYVWFAAVRLAPGVKLKKRRLRAARVKPRPPDRSFQTDRRRSLRS